MRQRFCWNKPIDNGTSFHGWRLDGLLLTLIAGEETPGCSWPQGERDRDWNELMDSPIGPVIMDFLREAAAAECEWCRGGGYNDCMHNAARAVLGCMEVVERASASIECYRKHEGTRAAVPVSDEGDG